MSVHTLTAGDGPWLVGIMNTDLSLAELEAFLELGGPLTPNDITSVEVSSRGRAIRTLGVMQPTGDGTTASIYFANQSLGGLRFSESGEGAGWTYWLFNLGKAMSDLAVWLTQVQLFVRFNKSG